jgi:tetratricopeptide (TPR) repeat protein
LARASQPAFRDLVTEAAGHYAAGRLADAEAAYRAALLISPQHAAVRHNLGVVIAAQGRHRPAIAFFDAALEIEPDYVSAHYNRAAALMALGQPRDAVHGFSRVCMLDPGHYEAHRALGFLWLAQGNRGRALDHFARTYELRRGEDRTSAAVKSLTTATHSKLCHDAEQFRYLAQRSRDAQRFEVLARNYEQVAKEIPERPVTLSNRQADMLGEDYNTAIHIRAAPELSGPAINERLDRAALVRRFTEEQAIYFDDLLTSAALIALQRYLLESTIWHDFSHIGGFVASYLEDGLACPLLLQVADELRAAFPELLSDQPLSQAWVFKGLQESSTIDVHADDAALSVNFWLTPAEANLDPGRGGMVVCRAPPPCEWEISDYNADRARIVTFLEQHGSDRLVVPYRENRAVVFKSRLFHYSDFQKFAQGYENHRINVTMLFG